MPALPVRTCVVSRQRHPQQELLRLVAEPDGRVRVDLPARQSGRGAWVLPLAQHLALLESRPRMLSRTLRNKGLRARGLLEEAQDQVLAATWQHLERCRRAGLLVSGHHAVGQAHDLVALIQARPRRSRDSAPPPAGAVGIPAPGPQGHLPIFELPVDPQGLGARIGRGPRTIVGIRGGGPAADLVRRLQWTHSLGYPPS